MKNKVCLKLQSRSVRLQRIQDRQKRSYFGWVKATSKFEVLLAVRMVVGENILEVLLAVRMVVGEHLFEAFLAVHMVLANTFLKLF